MRLNFLFTSLLIGLPLLAQVTPLPSTEMKDVVPALSSSGAATLQADCVQIDLAYPGGKKEQAELTVIYDPRTGYFLWQHSQSGATTLNGCGLYLDARKRQQKVVSFVDSSGLVNFVFAGTLFAKRWAGRAASIEAAVSASITEIRRDLSMLENRGYHMDYKPIPVFGPVPGVESKQPADFKPIPAGFSCEPLQSFCPHTNNTIASVEKQRDTWRIVLRDRFDVEVILDQNLDLVNIRQLTQPPPPKPGSILPGIPK